MNFIEFGKRCVCGVVGFAILCAACGGDQNKIQAANDLGQSVGRAMQPASGSTGMTTVAYSISIQKTAALVSDFLNPFHFISVDRYTQS